MNLIQTALIGTIITTGLFTGGTNKDLDLKSVGENVEKYQLQQEFTQDYQMQKAFDELNIQLDELKMVMRKAELDKFNDLQKATNEQQKARLKADLADLQKQGIKLVKLQHSIRTINAMSEKMKTSATLMLQSK